MNIGQNSNNSYSKDDGNLLKGLGRSSAKLANGIASLFSKKKLNKSRLDELEDLLISCDLGVASASKLTKEISHKRFNEDVSPDEIKGFLAEKISLTLEPVAKPLEISNSHVPFVVLFCGVNGSGKTTTIAKLAYKWRNEGRSVLLAAADTFRAAAIEQLQVWGDRAGCSVIASKLGADPAGLVFDAMNQAVDDQFDVLLIDTAGRLQNKKDLMAELEKIVRVMRKVDKTAPHSVILVMDATVGQNAHSQVELFKEAIDVSGLIITKLDGTARGGVIVALAEKFSIPVHAIGVGEAMEDLHPFEAQTFACAMMGMSVEKI